MKRTELLVLGLVMVIAVVMRLGGLSTTPPGLYPDEAMNGTNALEANRTGEYRLFYPDNNGREGLFINIQALSVRLFGNTPMALRQVSAVFGILTVLGVYLLTRRMFDDWRIAALAAFLIAVGFWHVNFSRIGFRAIMAPFCMVWAFYFLYRGIETDRLWPWAMSGLFWGLGFHTYIAFRIMPLALVAVLLAYWWSLWDTFSHSKYRLTRGRMLGGIACLVGVMIVVIMPLMLYFATHPGEFAGRSAQVSVLASDAPLLNLAKNIVLTFGMFFVYGDANWRHNLAGQPILFWPVAALFAAGLLRTLWRTWHSWRERGHPGLPHVILLSWFAVGLIPTVVSGEGLPHALRAIIVAPAVYIMAAMGLHWLLITLERMYASRDTKLICLPWVGHAGHWGRRMCTSEGRLIVAVVIVSVLAAVGIGDAWRYFVVWGSHPATAASFDAGSVDVAARLNALPPAMLKYVIVNQGGVLVDGVPMPAQTVMFLTDTGTPQQQRAKNIYYLTPEAAAKQKLPYDAFIIPLRP
jgi:4-amino-4-deoxy-L-arabinose transferase-like glycosyltransferase